MKIEAENLSSAHSLEALKDQVAKDLLKKLEDYANPKIGQRLLAQKMNISERTLSRLINLENRPTYQTLLKIYRVIFDSTNDAYILEVCPQIVEKEIRKHNPTIIEDGVNYSDDIESEIIHDRVFCEIYFLAATSPLSRELVQYRYGLHGMETLEKMCEMRALKLNNEGLYIQGSLSPNLSASTLKRVGLNLTQKFSKPLNTQVGGENLIGFYADGLDEKTYDEWLKIDERAFREKVRLSNEAGAKGEIRAFTFMVTDTMSEK